MKRIMLYVLISSWFTTFNYAASIQKPTENSHGATQLLQSIQRDLHDPHYRQDILPNNFSYLTQLLEYGSHTNQTREFAQESFGLFSKILKGAEYVNSYAFSSFIERLPALLKHYFAGYQLESANQLIIENDLDMLERLQRTVTSIVYSKFS